MLYTAKDYNALVGMEGFSETLIKNHFTLYQGYVTNTNKVSEILGQMLKDGKAGTPEYAELKRRTARGACARLRRVARDGSGTVRPGW